MAEGDKICMELTFAHKVTRTQQTKVKDFWNFLDSTGQLQPYKSTDSSVDKKLSRERSDCLTVSKLTSQKWRDQLKIFQEHGLDKAALTASGKPCKPCHTKTQFECSEFADTVKQPYEELLDDMKAFDEKLNKKTKSNTDVASKRLSIS